MKTDYFWTGQKIPADILVIAGNFLVNEATMTGESTPIIKARIERLVIRAQLIFF